MIYVIGGKGFVGSAYVRLFDALHLEHRVVTRENFDGFRGSNCDILINANGNSKKFLAEKNPLADFDMSVRSVAESLNSIRCGTYVLLSSGDVYPDQSRPEMTREDETIDFGRVSRYGLNKLLAEFCVRGQHPRWLILRMGGFIGPGLKKNAIFDMLTNAPVWLAPESELQYISTDSAARLVWRLLERGVTNEIVNLGARGVVRLGALHRRLASASVFRPDAPRIRYELSLDKLERLSGKTPPETEAEIGAFIMIAAASARAAST